MITQFQGEDRWTAIVSHYSFDIEEEDSFAEFLTEQGFSPDADDVIIESLYEQWREQNPI